MQLQDVRSRVRERLGLSTSDTAVTDAILNELVNIAHQKICLIHDWPWLHKTDATWTATVADQSVYTLASDLASDWRKTLYIVLAGDTLLLPKQKQDILRYSDTTGAPRFYSAVGSEIVLAPTPDAVYTISHEYIHVPAKVTVDATEFAIDDWAVDLLIDLTCVLVARRLRDYEMASMFMQDYAMTLDSLRDDVRRTRQLPRPRRRRDWP